MQATFGVTGQREREREKVCGKESTWIEIKDTILGKKWMGRQEGG